MAEGTPFIFLDGIVVHKETFKHFVEYLDKVAEVLTTFTLTAEAATTTEATNFITQSFIFIFYSVHVIIISGRIDGSFLIMILAISKV
jgi:hypothetical protein